MGNGLNENLIPHVVYQKNRVIWDLVISLIFLLIYFIEIGYVKNPSGKTLPVYFSADLNKSIFTIASEMLKGCLKFECPRVHEQ